MSSVLKSRMAPRAGAGSERRPRYIRRAAVLGAGVMGAQIAAHLVNAGVETVLFELPAGGADKDANARKAIQGLRKAQPTPLAEPAVADRIVPANYDTGLGQLGDCDFVIEAIAERLDLKRELFARIAPHLPAEVLLASNTSGLSINALAEVLPDAVRERFCGVHFFNPPRYMPLVELIPSRSTRPAVLDELETFLVGTLGKGVIRARDTPNFVANRIGVFSIAATIHHAERLGIPADVVDALTGPAIGRPKSATFRTADVVGLDTLQHVVAGSAKLLDEDPWQGYIHLPDWLDGLVAQGALGQKTRCGVYRKQAGRIQVFDPARGDYRDARQQADEALQAILAERDPAKKLAALHDSDHPQARFLWAIQRDVFHYAAYWLGEIADNARDVDLAMRWGFGWTLGPFETWQAAGWQRVAQWIRADIESGQALAAVPLPDWVDTLDAVHRPEASWSALDYGWHPRSELPVYQRQYFPDRVLGEADQETGVTTFETDAVRLWHLQADVGILSFRTPQNAIGADVLEGVLAAVAEAEQRYRALVLWQPKAPFSVGANLKQVVDALEREDYDALAAMVARFQQATGRLRQARIPVVGAVRGMALGGGCEFVMHCDHVVAALESYLGLVEAGVGLIPAGGGCKELARRASALTPDGDVFPFIRNYFEMIAMGKVARSAVEARRFGLLRPSDTVVLNPHEILHVAHAHARALAESGYRPPLETPVRVAGKAGLANLKAQLVNLHAGGFISDHDFAVAEHAAAALCGGEVEAGSTVPEGWLLKLEREPFMALLRSDKTRERIVHMLKTGKPLRN
ncbi:3-hydroxyacyl-CoA dehydrogenase/enoyl-CoA hydratase family protein [Alkalilimnicola ehrlichii]|uniref:3-hydroxyacyl-CoA dehydrogenase/enoyl-CoA hydratase family protein n=1 Tax=Alkalilimnicola ehrlichii TaxID=351052 RepID=UPI003BA2269B